MSRPLSEEGNHRNGEISQRENVERVQRKLTEQPPFKEIQPRKEEGMATHSSILAWRVSRTEGPGGLQSTGSLIVRHGWAIEPSTAKGSPERRGS